MLIAAVSADRLANVNAIITRHGITWDAILCTAVYEGASLPMIQCLLDHKCKTWSSALNHAIRRRDLPLAKVLRAAGCDWAPECNISTTKTGDVAIYVWAAIVSEGLFPCRNCTICASEVVHTGKLDAAEWWFSHAGMGSFTCLTTEVAVHDPFAAVSYTTWEEGMSLDMLKIIYRHGWNISSLLMIDRVRARDWDAITGKGRENAPPPYDLLSQSWASHRSRTASGYSHKPRTGVIIPRRRWTS